ncbi:MAG: aromatic acid exporter family protein [Myxococcaceae bacterium]
MNAGLAHPLYIAAKASLAALLALALVGLAGLPDKLSATFVAVVCISPTVYSGVRRGLDQLGASAIGGAVTWALSLVLPVPAVMGLALFLSIYLCFVVGLARGFLVAAFTVLYVLILPEASPGAALEHRLASVAIGVGSALLLNLLVSALSWRRVFRRRLSIARKSVAAEWEALAGALEGGAGKEKPRPLFDGSFVLLRTLFEELSDASRESRLLRGGPRASLSEALAAAHQLLAVAHHGKDLVLLLEREKGPFPGAAARARALSVAMGESTAPQGEPPLEPEVRGALQSAALAWEKARAAEQRFAA